MRDRRLRSDKPRSIAEWEMLRDGYIARMQSLDHQIKLAGDNLMEAEDLEDKWIGALRSYEFTCQKIAELA